MKNKKFHAAFALLFVALLISMIQISGCDSTKGSNIPTSPSGNTLTLSVSPSTVAADGSATSLITVTVTGNVSGAVTFTTTLGTLSASSVNVNSAGKAEATLKSSTAGIATVRATAGTLSTSTTVTFGQGGIAITGTGVTAGAGVATTITFTVTDVNGNPIGGLEVTLAAPTTSTADTAFWSDTSPNTSTSGVATSLLNTTSIGHSTGTFTSVIVTILAEATGAGSASTTVTFTAP